MYDVIGSGGTVNKGRGYHKCANGACKFKKFCTAKPSAETGGAAPAMRPPPNCHCFLASRVVTTTKEGANKGKRFFTCDKARDAPDK